MDCISPGKPGGRSRLASPSRLGPPRPLLRRVTHSPLAWVACPGARAARGCKPCADSWRPPTTGGGSFSQPAPSCAKSTSGAQARDPSSPLERGEPFFFKLKAPFNAIGGFGLFARFDALPVWRAWDVFGQANGTVDPDAPGRGGHDLPQLGLARRSGSRVVRTGQAPSSGLPPPGGRIGRGLHAPHRQLLHAFARLLPRRVVPEALARRHRRPADRAQPQAPVPAPHGARRSLVWDELRRPPARPRRTA